MHMRCSFIALAACLLACPPGARAQSFPTDDSVIEQHLGRGDEGISDLAARTGADGLDRTAAGRLAGARRREDLACLPCTRTGAFRRASEEYGTWRGWRQGALHVDMVAPRTQTLEARTAGIQPGERRPGRGRRRRAAGRPDGGVIAGMAGERCRQVRADHPARAHVPRTAGTRAVRETRDRGPGGLAAAGAARGGVGTHAGARPEPAGPRACPGGRRRCRYRDLSSGPVAGASTRCSTPARVAVPAIDMSLRRLRDAVPHGRGRTGSPDSRPRRGRGPR